MSLALVTQGSRWERNPVLLLCSLSVCLDCVRGSTGIGWLCLLKQRRSWAQLHGTMALLFCTTVVLDVKILERKKNYEVVDFFLWTHLRVMVIFLPGFQPCLQVTLVKPELFYSISADNLVDLGIQWFFSPS